MNLQTCCFIGHRKLPQERLPEIKQHLIDELEALIGHGINRFMSAGKVGFDGLAAFSVLELKERYPHIRLVMVLPQRDHNWPYWDMALGNKQLLDGADEMEYVTDEYPGASRETCGHYLVSHSAYCIAYRTKKSGMTVSTLRIAEKQNLSVVNIAELVAQADGVRGTI